MKFSALVAILALSSFAADPTPVATASAASATTEGQRVFVCGHSFHVYIAKPLEELAAAATIAKHANLGVQFIGGSSVTQHWELPDEKNKCKQALATGNVDVLTLSPNWIMPDPAIDRFVDLALAKNPNVRVVVQMSWPAFDTMTLTSRIMKNEERDTKTVEEIAKVMDSAKPVFEKQLEDINKRLGKQVVFVAPVGRAVLMLRDKVIKGEAPGVTKQSELFSDSLGHGKEPIQRLATYCYYATIYRKSPVGLAVFEKKGNENWNKLNRILQQLAWDAVTQYPLSGVKSEPK
jgi:hypothetical protein